MASQSIPFGNVQTESDADLMSQVQSLTGCMRQHISGFYTESMNFFSNISNMPVVRQVIGIYGIPACGDSWVPFYKFYQQCLYYSKFPIPSADQANCTVLKTMQDQINTEIDNIKKRMLPGGGLDGNSGPASMSPLNDILSDIEGLYGTLNCDAAIVSQQQSDQIATVQAVAQQAASTTAGTTQTATGNVLLYSLIGVGALLLIGGIIIIFHHHHKST